MKIGDVTVVSPMTVLSLDKGGVCAAVRRDPVSGQAVWHPAGPGFSRITVIDADERRAEARVRVKG